MTSANSINVDQQRKPNDCSMPSNYRLHPKYHNDNSSSSTNY